jgi:hypothetical protein
LEDLIKEGNFIKKQIENDHKNNPLKKKSDLIKNYKLKKVKAPEFYQFTPFKNDLSKELKKNSRN